MRKHIGKLGFIVAIILAFVVPAAALSTTSVLNGGDTLAVSCSGLRLDQTQVDATHRNLSCVANPTSTTSTTSTTTSSTSSTTTTMAPTGQFSDSFTNLGNWAFAHFAYENLQKVPDARSTATTVNGQARIEAFDQNYGDATLRSVVKYNLASGGTVTLDMTDNGAGNPLVGFANVSFSANPDDAKSSMADERPDAYSPANLPTDALQIQLRDNCRVPWAPPVVVRYGTNLPGGRTTQRGNCAATPDGHWRFVFTAGHLSIRNGANAEVVGYDVTVPSTGWFILGVHNHASVKYQNQASVVGLYDNVVYPTTGGGQTTTTGASTTSTTTTTLAPPTTQPGGSNVFTESFANDQRSRFDFQLHTAANGNIPVPVRSTFLGEHNTACQGPDTYRSVQGGQTGYPFSDASGTGLSWWCAPSGDPSSGHFMTALTTEGIATLSFTPKQTFTDIKQVCWDQNMNNLGEGKWVNVFVVPAGDIAANGGDFSYSAVTGLPFGGVDHRPPAGSFDFTWVRGSTFVNKWSTNGGHTETMNYWDSIDGVGIVPDGPLAASPRFKICLNSGGNMVIQRPNGTTDTRSVGTTFPSGPVKVIFQDASYNPEKHNGTDQHLTWHWDNISVSTSSAIIPASYTMPSAQAMQYCAL